MINNSLHRYLTTRYIAVLILLTLVFSFLISFMNLSGMDDTTEYYMAYEAEVLSEYYQPTDKIIEFDLGKKEYYWGDENLPERYKNLIKQSVLEDHKANLYQSEDQFIYIFPYEHKEGLIFYVIHIFTPDTYTQGDQVLTDILTLISLMIVSCVIFYILKINRTVIQQIGDFHHWVKKVTEAEIGSIPQDKIPDDIYFDELLNTAETLAASLQLQHELRMKSQEMLQREKDFLSTLSHELRTPIAIISAATSLLKKRNQLTEKDISIVEKLIKANRNMQQLAETLLQLWRKQKGKQAKQQISLRPLIQEAIDNCAVYFAKELNISIDENQAVEVVEKIELVKIVVNNLLRNACQYSEGGNINLTLNGKSLCITNGYRKSDFENKSQLQFGFGVGLYLVEIICEQQNWQYVVKNNKDTFSVTVTF